MQDAFLEAVNQIVGNSREYLKILQQNLELAIKQVNPASVEYLDARMENLQRELIDRTERQPQSIQLRGGRRRNPAPSAASGADGDGRCIEGRIPEPYQGTTGVHSVPAETPDL